jgi:peptidoglycan/LPS O-acetylase OafA/YrhL
MFRSKWSLVIAFGLTAAAGLIEKPPFSMDWQMAESVHLAGLFVFGILLARERGRIGSWFLRGPWLFGASMAGVTVGALLLCLFPSCRLAVLLGSLFPNALECVRHWLIAIAAGGLIIISTSSAFCKSILSWGPIHFLGEISYSLYLWHFIVILYCVHLLYGRLPFDVILCLAFVLSIIVSRCSYFWVEVPAMNVGRKLSNAFQRPVRSGEMSIEETKLSTFVR